MKIFHFTRNEISCKHRLRLTQEDVYMRPEMKSTRIEIATYHKFCLHSSLLRAKWNEFPFGGGPLINAPLIFSQSILFTHVQMFLFIWFHFGQCLHDVLSPEMKFHFCQNDRNEFHFGLYQENGYKKLTRHRNENISFRPKWNPM